MQKHIKRFLNLRIILYMSNLILKSTVIFAMFIIVNNIHSQNNGELVGANKHSINQNYKIPNLTSFSSKTKILKKIIKKNTTNFNNLKKKG